MYFVNSKKKQWLLMLAGWWQRFREKCWLIITNNLCKLGMITQAVFYTCNGNIQTDDEQIYFATNGFFVQSYARK